MKVIKLPPKHIKLLNRTPISFIGNKANRRTEILSLIKNLFREIPSMQNHVFDPFAGSFYLSHVVQVAAQEIGREIVSHINDYDNIVEVFSKDFREHAINVVQIVESCGLAREQRLPPEACQRIDDYINANCPHYDKWFQKFLTMYGGNREYRCRLTSGTPFVKSQIQISSYVPNSLIYETHIDYRDFVKIAAKKSGIDPNKPSLWLCDPPYATYKNSKIMYGDGCRPMEFSKRGIAEDILSECPAAYVITFGYERNFDMEDSDNLHYEELNEFFAALKGLTVNSRPEYIHLWYKGKFKLLANKIVEIPISDHRTGKKSWRGEHEPNFKYDENYGCF
jgi:hypothetical protein